MHALYLQVAEQAGAASSELLRPLIEPIAPISTLPMPSRSHFHVSA